VIDRHRQLARLAPNGRHVVAAQSGHWIQFDEPDLVVAIIRETVERARTGKGSDLDFPFPAQRIAEL